MTLSVVLLLVAAGFFAAASAQRDRQVQVPPGRPDSRLDGPVAPAPPLARSVPVSLAIPSIGLATSIDTIGNGPGGTIADPVDFERASWYAPGPSPGQAGSAVIIGHVDSYRGPAVFFRLGELSAGETVTVTLADGSSAKFMVRQVETMPKHDFSADRVYAQHSGSDLVLITCGGDFDSAHGSYRSNVIVYSTMISSQDPSASTGGQ
ncbi:sortase domain-containing protein [Nocardia cyriacigeorgica]